MLLDIPTMKSNKIPIVCKLAAEKKEAEQKKYVRVQTITCFSRHMHFGGFIQAFKFVCVQNGKQLMLLNNSYADVRISDRIPTTELKFD